VRALSLVRLRLAYGSLRNNNAHHRVREAFENSLSALKTGYIDLFLMHWPQASVDDRTLAPEESPTIGDTWREMEKLLDTGDFFYKFWYPYNSLIA
jgi:glycerol 2-dehydrogenase (NADP+)